MKSKILKTYNKELNMIIIFNICLFIFIQYKFMLLNLNSILNKINILHLAGLIFISYFPSILIVDIIPKEYKKKVVKEYSRDLIFTTLEKQKNEIDFNLLEKEYSYSKKDKEDQHFLWYCLYRKYEYDPRIFQINKKYLLCRDYIIINILLCIFLLFFSLFFSINRIGLVVWLIIIFIESYSLRKVANSFSKRLVKSVLIEESFQLKNKEFIQ